jgi:hypothetical protein
MLQQFRAGLLLWAAFPLVAATLLLGCGGKEDPPAPAPGADAYFPSNFRTSYDRVRDCRLSIEHDLVHIVVYADPDSSARYLGEDYPFEPGTVVVKEEFSDDNCSDRNGFTVMRKAEPGEHEDTLGWEWQRLDSNRNLVTANIAECVSCHTDCGVDRDATCTLP